MKNLVLLFTLIFVRSNCFSLRVRFENDSLPVNCLPHFSCPIIDPIDVDIESVEPCYQRLSVQFVFSNYKKFVSFRNRLPLRMSNLLFSMNTNQNRSLIIQLKRLEPTEDPLNYLDLIELGDELDHFLLFVDSNDRLNYHSKSIFNQNKANKSIFYRVQLFVSDTRSQGKRLGIFLLFQRLSRSKQAVRSNSLSDFHRFT